MAPADIFPDLPSAQPVEVDAAPTSTPTTTSTPADASGADEQTSVFVKNLSFDTVESTLEDVFGGVGELKSVKIPRRRDPKRPGEMLSSGYGFVEYVKPKHARRAIRRLQDVLVDGHALKISLAKTRVVAAGEDAAAVAEVRRRRAAQSHANRQTDAEDNADSDVTRTKLLVKNLPFEATKRDLRRLFGAYGAVRSVRVPRKPDGSNRGFAFVDFVTHEEALRARDALAQVHLYGRHLVLQWAREGDGTSLKEVQERTRKLYAAKV
jgi:multiple RNA-binding domain-containing protein 1